MTLFAEMLTKSGSVCSWVHASTHAWPLFLFCFKQANSISACIQTRKWGRDRYTNIQACTPIITVGSRRRAHDVHAWRISLVRTSKDKVRTNDSCWSMEMVYVPKVLSGVSTTGLGVDGVLQPRIRMNLRSLPLKPRI
jgi:hypothetical protein